MARIISDRSKSSKERFPKVIQSACSLSKRCLQELTINNPSFTTNSFPSSISLRSLVALISPFVDPRSFVPRFFSLERPASQVYLGLHEAAGGRSQSWRFLSSLLRWSRYAHALTCTYRGPADYLTQLTNLDIAVSVLSSRPATQTQLAACAGLGQRTTY